MSSDFWLVVRWWGVLFLVGAAAFPLTKRLFSSWHDRGYLFSKAVGMAVVTWVVYVLGTVRVLPFTAASIAVSMVLVFVGGMVLERDKREKREKREWKRAALLMVLEELFFLAALLFWSWIKAHEPSIRGLEKFMDYGFMQSILNSRYFPPRDMWYPPLPINYYYFGHLVTAVLTKLSGIDLAYAFNLMLATLFALTLTMSFSIGKQIGVIGKIGARGEIGEGILTAFLVTLAGNMQTIYAFTRGYTGDDVQPFWQLLWPIGAIRGIGEIWGKIGEGMQTYWYANATRFIPFTIHEFPSYSFVVSDVHGHVLSLPFVLLAIALLIGLREERGGIWGRGIFYGFLVGVLLMTNALDGPIYLVLFIVVFVMLRATTRSGGVEKFQEKVLDFARTIVPVLVAAAVTSLPFLSHFKSFVSGLAVNCPPAILANTKIGPLLFESAEKCQRSPLWMLWILWGFFVYCGVFLIRGKRGERGSRGGTRGLLLVFFFFSIGLIIFPEFFYFKDIYPAHFRSNTMFKLGYQAFILFSIVSGYSIVSFLSGYSVSSHRKFSIFNFQFSNKKILFFVLLLPQLFLVSIFPIFSVRSYFNGLKKYEGLYGLNWMQKEYPDDWAGIQWLNQNASMRQRVNASAPVIVEADGDSYTDYARFSAFTGIPTIIGWGVHEWLWRGTYDVVAPRRTDVQQVYESTDLEATRTILTRFGVRYIIVGTLERQKYPALQEWKFGQLGRVAFQSGQTTIYQVE